MATTYNKLLLDINEKPNDIITAVQNDTNSRYLDVLLYDNGVPINLDGCEVKIFMNKPEKGGEIWNNGVITDAENGRCEFLLTTEALTHFGHMQAQISIWKENVEILSTQIFEIIVTKSLLGNSSVEASNEYGTLVILFQNLYEAYDLMTRMVENIGVPAEVAAQHDLATMWQAWEFLVAYMKGDLTDKINEAIANASVQGVLDVLNTTTAKENTSQNILNKLASGVTADFRSPIKVACGHVTKSGGAVTGNGKGVLFVSPDNPSSKMTLVIDGITLATNAQYFTTEYTSVSFEFTESFSLASTSDTSSYQLYYAAVFY